jgi:hypothetical protein
MKKQRQFESKIADWVKFPIDKFSKIWDNGLRSPLPISGKRRFTMSHTVAIDPQVLAQAIAQALAPAIADAVAQAIAPVNVKPAVPAASTRAQARKKDALSIAADKARTRANKSSAPVEVTAGTIAAAGVNYKLVDKAANMKKQCVMPCRKRRKGRSRFCPTHAKENFISIRETGVSIDADL